MADRFFVRGCFCSTKNTAKRLPLDITNGEAGQLAQKCINTPLFTPCPALQAADLCNCRDK
jgi:hypothetical protein